MMPKNPSGFCAPVYNPCPIRTFSELVSSVFEVSLYPIQPL